MASLSFLSLAARSDARAYSLRWELEMGLELGPRKSCVDWHRSYLTAAGRTQQSPPRLRLSIYSVFIRSSSEPTLLLLFFSFLPAPTRVFPIAIAALYHPGAENFDGAGSKRGRGSPRPPAVVFAKVRDRFPLRCGAATNRTATGGAHRLGGLRQRCGRLAWRQRRGEYEKRGIPGGEEVRGTRGGRAPEGSGTRTTNRRCLLSLYWASSPILQAPCRRAGSSQSQNCAGRFLCWQAFRGGRGT